jgi:DNA-binding MarR family transcriptional regulator
MTKRLEASGLLARVPDARDRRVVRVRLTERGRSLREVLPSMLEGVADRAMSGLTGAERDQLIMLLDRVAANVAARRPPPGAPAC